MEISYNIYGDGPAVVFLHGWGRSKEDFDFLFTSPFNYKAVCIDLPGFGQSDLDTSLITPLDYTNRIFQLLKQLDIKPVLIVGHSYGGKLAFLLAQKYDYCKLLLISPSLVKPRFNLKVFIKIRLYKLRKFFVKLHLLKPPKKVGSSDYQNSNQHLKKVLVSAVNNYYDKKLERCNGEMTLFWGIKDQATPIYMAKRIKRKVKDCQLITISGGHFAFIEHKYQLIKTIKELL